MLKRFSKNLFDVQQTAAEPTYHAPLNRPTNPFSSDLMNAIDPHGLESEEIRNEDEEPETTIAKHVSIKGTLTFQKLIRIDGHFEGELISSGKLIIGPTGTVKANIDLDEAFISGKVEGDIKVKSRLVLRGRAEVRGDITAPLLSVDEGVSIVGILHIVQQNDVQAAPSSEEIEEDPYTLSD